MQDVSNLREGWDSVEIEETRLLRDMIIREIMQQWLKFRHAYNNLPSGRVNMESPYQSILILQRRLRNAGIPSVVIGGLVVDFLVFRVPQFTTVWVKGEYWLAGRQTEVDFLQQIL